MSDPLALPDSLAWHAGVLHERDRVILLLEQRYDALGHLPECSGWDTTRKAAARAELKRAITAIREAG